MVLLVKPEDVAAGGGAKTTATPVNESLPVQQQALTSSGTATSQSELDAAQQQQRQSRKDFFEKGGSKSLKSQLKSPFKFLGKTLCGGCKKKCSGEVLRVNDKYFHSQCFKCVECQTSLATGGFFTKDSKYYCTKCYQTNYGTKCAKCNEYVEGEVVSALGNTFHQKCFTCARCRKPFPTGERVTFTGKNCLCQTCIQAEKELDSRLVSGVAADSTAGGDKKLVTANGTETADSCAGCGHELKDGQALVALDKQYHIWCFKCTTCSVLLHGEYMGHEGRPYCEKDYHERYGVKCAYCRRFISGKVLQAGDNNHFHPTCARCSKCGDPFGDGEEMYLQGTAIWHPRCGPGPGESGFVINGFGGDTSSLAGDGYFDGMSSTMSELHYGVNSGGGGGIGIGSRASSPGGSLIRDYRSQSPGIPYAYSYLRGQGARSVSSLRRPIDPYDRKASHPPMHFHVPDKSRKGSSVVPQRPSSRTGMRALVNNLQAMSPRPRSPHMNNEEPIEMSHYPDGKREAERVAPIERDDFPAPPFLYADIERRRRWSEPMKKEEDNSPGVEIPPEVDEIDAKLRTQEETLRKISNGSSMGRVFLDTVKQREKINAQRRAFIDPRSYARTPSATREPQFRLRYDSPVNASPSRISTHERPQAGFLPEEEPASFFRSSSGRSLGTTTPSGGHHHTMHSSTPSYRIVSSHGGPPKPGYTRKTSTLPSPGGGGGGLNGGGSLSPGFTAFEAGLEEKNFYSTEFSSRSDVSEKSYDIADGRVSSHSINRRDLKSSTTYTQGLRNISTFEPSGRSYSAHINRSLPNMSAPLPKAPKIYPIHLLMITNYRLPNDVDRCNLERHLSDTDFELVFEMPRSEFYRLPQWRRNEMKKRVKLF